MFWCCRTFELVRHFHINCWSQYISPPFFFLTNKRQLRKSQSSRNHLVGSSWIVLINSKFKILATLSQDGNMGDEFHIACRNQKRTFFSKICEVFECSYAADNPLFVKDETITALEVKRMGRERFLEIASSKPTFGSAESWYRGTSPNGLRKILGIDFAEVRRRTRRCTSLIKMVKVWREEKVYNKNVRKYLWFMLLGNKESWGSRKKKGRKIWMQLRHG